MSHRHRFGCLFGRGSPQKWPVSRFAIFLAVFLVGEPEQIRFAIPCLNLLDRLYFSLLVLAGIYRYWALKRFVCILPSTPWEFMLDACLGADVP